MNDWPTTLLEFWTATASHLWQSILVLLLLGALAFTLRKAPARIQNGLWTIGLAKLAIPVSVMSWAFHKTGFTLPGWLTGSEAASGSITIDIVSGIWSPIILTAPPETFIGTGTTIFLVLLTAGWAVTAFRLLERGITAWHTGRLKQPITAADLDPAIRERLMAVLKMTGIDQRHLQLSRDSRAPGVSGFLNPRIRLAEDLLGALDDKALQAVLLHEDAHRRRYEPLRYGIQRLVFCLFFYFPPLWLLLRQLNYTAELACDEAAMDNGTQPETYLATLRKVVALDLGPATSLAAMAGARPSGFAKRIFRIHAYERRPVMPRHRVALLAGVVVLSISFFTAGALENNPAGPGNPAAEIREQLEGLEGTDIPIILNFQEVELGKILDAIGDATGIQIEMEGAGHENVSVDLDNTTLAGTLTWLAVHLDLTYTVLAADWLVVHTPFIPGLDGVTNPIKREGSYVQPMYPEAARRDMVQGAVILQAIIGADGSVGSITVLREEQPDYGFRESAVEAVRQWRYDPATRDGVPVPVYLTINVRFSLE